MNWNNLRNNKCPRCKTELEEGDTRVIICGIRCGFSIGKEKMSEIIGGMNARAIRR